MKYILKETTAFNPGGKPRWTVYPYDGSLAHGVPTNGWATENMARRWVQKNGDSIVEVKRLQKKIKDKYSVNVMDKLFITLNGFANENGPLKKDTRKGLKPYEVTFFVKNPTTGTLKPSGRSKMASSLEEAKRWAEREGKTYKNLVKIDVKEFKDSVDAICEKYLGDVSLKPSVSSQVSGQFVSQLLKQIANGKEKTIPRSFIDREIKYAMEWGEKDQTLLDKYDKASALEKRNILLKLIADYFVKFKWAIASRMEKAGLLKDSTEESTIDSIREKYQADAPSKAEIAKYYRFIVVAEGMDGKMIRPSGGSYYKKYEDALRAAKSLEKPTTHHLFIEGEYANAPSMNHNALYTWRNPKAK